jgi:hypothetical protein
MPKTKETPKKRILRKLTQRHRFDARDIFEALAIISDGKSTFEPKARRRMMPYVHTVFERLKLDGSEAKHWMYATTLLACAIYQRKPAGRAKVWTKKRVRELRDDLDTVRAQNSGLGELELCELLLKTKPDKYRGQPETLRRRLYSQECKDSQKKKRFPTR